MYNRHLCNLLNLKQSDLTSYVNAHTSLLQMYNNGMYPKLGFTEALNRHCFLKSASFLPGNYSPHRGLIVDFYDILQIGCKTNVSPFYEWSNTVSEQYEYNFFPKIGVNAYPETNKPPFYFRS